MTMVTPRSETSDKRARAKRGPWHKQVAGLHVLKLEGDDYQMGRQHGELLRDVIPAGPLPYYKDYIERLMGKSRLGALAPYAWPMLQRLVGRRVAGAFPAFALDAMRGLADGAGLDYQQVLEGCSMPDSLLWVASRVMQLKNVGPAMHHRLALGIGCTSAIAHGRATVDGKLLHARNLDYHGVGCWPRTAAVVFHAPSEGLRYVSASAAGVLLGGFTAMNEAGLSLAVHQHMFTAEARLGGTPIGVVGDMIMRRARSLDDAEAILNSHTPIGCWTYLVTDGHRREVLCWEENPDRRVAMRYDSQDDTFGYTNIYLDPELGSTERDLYGAYWRHNVGRLRRVRGLLADNHGRIAPPTMASFLADRGETRCRIATSISMLMTVGSVVFRPEDGVFWVATGEAPTSSHAFVPFDLAREDHAPEHGNLDAHAGGDEAAREAFDAYRRAYIAYLDDGDLGRARELIDVARQRQREQPLYHVLGGLLALQHGDAEAAFDALSVALELGHEHPERLASFHLWRGRAADLAGRRAQGTSDYRASLGHHGDPAVRDAALAGLRRAYKPRSVRAIDVDFTYADVVAP